MAAVGQDKHLGSREEAPLKFGVPDRDIWVAATPDHEGRGVHGLQGGRGADGHGAQVGSSPIEGKDGAPCAWVPIRPCDLIDE